VGMPPCKSELPRGQHNWAQLEQVSRKQLRFGMSSAEIEELLGSPDRSETYPCDLHSPVGGPPAHMCGSWNYYGKDKFKSLLLIMEEDHEGEPRLRSWAL
jgi:hypothetical protein